MYPGLSHDEIIEECLKELKHHFEVGPEVALISAEKGVQCVPFDESLQKKFPYFEGTYEVFDVPHRESESARAYGRYQNVFLTDEEMADLQASFPTVWGQYIEKLSEYMASTGKRYQSHAATIRRWAGEDAKKAAPPTRNRDYSVKEDETV